MESSAIDTPGYQGLESFYADRKRVEGGVLAGEPRQCEVLAFCCMGKIRYFLAVSSLAVGVLILLFSLLQPDRPALGIAFGVLLALNGIIRLYIGQAG